MSHRRLDTDIPGWTPILYDIAQALESIVDPQARIERVLTLLQVVLPYDRSALLESDSLLDEPICIVPRAASHEESEALKQRLDKLLAMLADDDAHLPPFEAPEPPAEPLSTHLALPILSGGELFGVLFVERWGPAYGQTHVAFLSIVAAQLGAYLTVLRTEMEKSALLEKREKDIEFMEMFVAMLGHDLRTPLTAITLLSDIIREDAGETIREPLDRIRSSTDRMVHMVDQLLDLTRIRLSQGIPVERKHVDLANICRQAIREISIRVPGESSIRFDAKGNTSGFWDPQRLLQVLSNLVSNAVEHARGDRAVDVSLQGQGDTVTLAVHNPGVISPDRIPTLFEPFYGGRREPGARGLGLGLFIVKHIVEAHEGTVRVDSSEEEGTTFTVVLPRAHLS